MDNGPTLFGVGIDSNIVTASFRAIVTAVNRHISAAWRKAEEKHGTIVPG
jgi:2-isopropylmalate synthase